MQPDEFQELSRSELIERATSMGVERAEVLTRVELVDEIIRRMVADPVERSAARGFLGVARDLVASVVERGLHLPETAPEIRSKPPTSSFPASRGPIATVTLAEIYSAQGHRARAMHVLDELLVQEPDHRGARDLRERIAGAVGGQDEMSPPTQESADRPAERAAGAGAGTEIADESWEAIAAALATADAAPLPSRELGAATDPAPPAWGSLDRDGLSGREALDWPHAGHADRHAGAQGAGPWEPVALPGAATDRVLPAVPDTKRGPLAAAEAREPWPERATSSPEGQVREPPAGAHQVQRARESSSFPPEADTTKWRPGALSTQDRHWAEQLAPVDPAVAMPPRAAAPPQRDDFPATARSGAPSSSPTVEAGHPEPSDGALPALGEAAAPRHTAITLDAMGGEPDSVVALELGPGLVYVYWEITAQTASTVAPELGAGEFVLRLMVAEPTWCGPRVHLRERDVRELVGGCLITDLPAHSTLRAALGWKSNGGFQPLAIASRVTRDDRTTRPTQVRSGASQEPVKATV